jgi:hypothetical protein
LSIENTSLPVANLPASLCDASLEIMKKSMRALLFLFV